jgi:enoyl-CoA hydratase/carnithine racemase
MLNAPYTELGVLLRAVTGAEFLARFGGAERGYLLLAGHLYQAQQATQAGCPWAREFVAAYRLALADYVSESGTLLEPAGTG